ncbi:MAG: chromosome partitioning protein ParB [Deltaproteobacteria bacterium]|jgi:hypothetical protein|nr:chromosome partitioning protein ParB [Deltaproteobacteria bacterium]
MAKLPLAKTTARVPQTGTRRNKQTVVSDDSVIRVNFDLTRSDHVKLKVYAAKSGCSMADLLRAFVASLKMSGVK